MFDDVVPANWETLWAEAIAEADLMHAAAVLQHFQSAGPPLGGEWDELGDGPVPEPFDGWSTLTPSGVHAEIASAGMLALANGPDPMTDLRGYAVYDYRAISMWRTALDLIITADELILGIEFGMTPLERQISLSQMYSPQDLTREYVDGYWTGRTADGRTVLIDTNGDGGYEEGYQTDDDGNVYVFGPFGWTLR